MYTHEIWDRVSPINGVPAETMLANYPETADGRDILLVKEGDRVIMFQTHDPEQPGFQPLTEARVAELGAAYVDSLANPPEPVLSEVEQKAALFDQMVEAGVVKKAVKDGHLNSESLSGLTSPR